MKRSRKTLFALLLALVMALGLTATAWAAEGDENGAIVVIPGDGSGVGNNVVQETYRIPFTKVVKQAGTCAPGKETFTFEAVPLTDAGDAVFPDVQRSVKIETNGVGTYQGTLTITGPAVQVQNFAGRGFYVREVQGNDQRWTYSEDEYLVAFDIDNATQQPMLKFYLNDEEKSEITFTNIYTENLTTVEIPFTKTVKLNGNTAPGKTDFKLEIFDVGNGNTSEYKDVTYTAVVTTKGVGNYDGKLIISGPTKQVKQFVCEGFSVREVNDNLPRWTYSDAVWYVLPGEAEDENGIPKMNIYSTRNVEGAAAVDQMTFENTYTRNTSYTTPDEKPISSPKTFDAGVALYGVNALLSLTGTALVIKRKNG